MSRTGLLLLCFHSCHALFGVYTGEIDDLSSHITRILEEHAPFNESESAMMAGLHAARGINRKDTTGFATRRVATAPRANTSVDYTRAASGTHEASGRVLRSADLLRFYELLGKQGRGVGPAQEAGPLEGHFQQR